jgi:8-oxo-dGTP diphosphatase
MQGTGQGGNIRAHHSPLIPHRTCASASPPDSSRGWFPTTRVRESRNPRASPGGTPEPEDADLVATLVREAFEENQVRVGATAYLGYQEVHRPGRARYAQVRMAGVIEEFAARAPDPDGGRIYRRLMTSLDAAPDVLGWGEPAVAQARAASRVAWREWGLPVDVPAPSGYAD